MTVPRQQGVPKVKKYFLVAALVAALCPLGVLVSEVHAQAPRGIGSPVAILDLTYIFKNHLRFQQMSDGMRRDVDAAENALKTDRDGYRKMTEQLETYRKGTPEYRAMEEELAKKAAELNLRVSIQKKDFLEQEAKIYYNVYQEIVEHVKYYSEQHGIALVLRFNGDPVDRNDPQEVLKELNKSVLYYNRAIDITPIILEEINRKTPGGPQGGVPQTSTPGAPGFAPPGAPPGLPPRR
jgi:Skp family chaperone for outer membrane proteins